MEGLTDTLFHVAWWMLAVVGIGGVALFFFGNRRLDKTLQRVGVGLVLLAVILAGLRILFPIARERMEIRTRHLIRAVERRDWDALKGYLDDETAVGTSSQSYVVGRSATVALARHECEAHDLVSISIPGIDSQQTQSIITVSVDVISTQDTADAPTVSSGWEFDYQKSGDRWILAKITLNRIGEQSADQFFNPFAR